MTRILVPPTKSSVSQKRSAQARGEQKKDTSDIAEGGQGIVSSSSSSSSLSSSSSVIHEQSSLFTNIEDKHGDMIIANANMEVEVEVEAKVTVNREVEGEREQHECVTSHHPIVNNVVVPPPDHMVKTSWGFAGKGGDVYLFDERNNAQLHSVENDGVVVDVVALNSSVSVVSDPQPDPHSNSICNLDNQLSGLEDNQPMNSMPLQTSLSLSPPPGHSEVLVHSNASDIVIANAMDVAVDGDVSLLNECHKENDALETTITTTTTSDITLTANITANINATIAETVETAAAADAAVATLQVSGNKEEGKINKKKRRSADTDIVNEMALARGGGHYVGEGGRGGGEMEKLDIQELENKSSSRARKPSAKWAEGVDTMNSLDIFMASRSNVIITYPKTSSVTGISTHGNSNSNSNGNEAEGSKVKIAFKGKRSVKGEGEGGVRETSMVLSTIVLTMQKIVAINRRRGN